MADEARLSYRPAWAPHVVGTYPPRVLDEDGVPQAQRIHMLCEKCGATFQFDCTSGSVRARISQFALTHDHRDPFKKPVGAQG